MSLAKEAMFASNSAVNRPTRTEFGYGAPPANEHQGWRNEGENRGKSPDQERAEVAFYEALSGKKHPKRLRAEKKLRREERDTGQANFSRESNSLGFGGFSGGARGLAGNPGGPGGGA